MGYVSVRAHLCLCSSKPRTFILFWTRVSLIHTYDDDYDEDDGSNDSCLIYSAYTYTYTKYIHCVSPHDNSAR